jgi:hypothetical protein
VKNYTQFVNEAQAVSESPVASHETHILDPILRKHGYGYSHPLRTGHHVYTHGTDTDMPRMTIYPNPRSTKWQSGSMRTGESSDGMDKYLASKHGEKLGAAGSGI